MTENTQSKQLRLRLSSEVGEAIVEAFNATSQELYGENLDGLEDTNQAYSVVQTAIREFPANTFVVLEPIILEGESLTPEIARAISKDGNRASTTVRSLKFSTIYFTGGLITMFIDAKILTEDGKKVTASTLAVALSGLRAMPNATSIIEGVSNDDKIGFASKETREGTDTLHKFLVSEMLVGRVDMREDSKDQEWEELHGILEAHAAFLASRIHLFVATDMAAELTRRGEDGEYEDGGTVEAKMTSLKSSIKRSIESKFRRSIKSFSDPIGEICTAVDFLVNDSKFTPDTQASASH